MITYFIYAIYLAIFTISLISLALIKKDRIRIDTLIMKNMDIRLNIIFWDIERFLR